MVKQCTHFVTGDKTNYFGDSSSTETVRNDGEITLRSNEIVSRITAGPSPTPRVVALNPFFNELSIALWTFAFCENCKLNEGKQKLLIIFMNSRGTTEIVGNFNLIFHSYTSI